MRLGQENSELAVALENDLNQNRVMFDSPYLIRSEALAAQLDDPALRIFDCTTRLVPDPELFMRAEACDAEYALAHIPGAGYLDLQGALSDSSSRWRFMMPPLDDLAAAFGRCGIGAESRVVLYDTNNMMWATRIWWMLRAIGFDNAALLDGGLKNWKREGRALSDAPCNYPATSPLQVKAETALLVGQDAVRTALDAPETSVINALSFEQFSGDGVHYGRPGRIPGSVCAPARDMTDPETGLLKSSDTLRAIFTDADVAIDQPILCYCGGGIAATLDAFVLTLLGADDVTVYDASLSEWAQDSNLPMETG
jgi:thiosulfate/3-mercaptopyruvate sulfurtransferase